VSIRGLFFFSELATKRIGLAQSGPHHPNYFLFLVFLLSTTTNVILKTFLHLKSTITCDIVDIQQSGCVRHYITDKYKYFRIHDSCYGIVMIYTDFLQKFEVVSLSVATASVV
jgi:hypothetical protein